MTPKTDRSFGMVVDLKRCVGCSACVIACKSENAIPDGHCRRWVEQVVEGRFPNLKMEVWSNSCQHCSEAPCVTNCPTGASHVDLRNGTVQVERQLCTGCKACLAACPYDARYIHPEGFADKCTLCSHRLEAGQSTACAAICPTSAIVVGDLSNPDSSASRLLQRRKWKQQRPEAGTRPKFFLLD